MEVAGEISVGIAWDKRRWIQRRTLDEYDARDGGCLRKEDPRRLVVVSSVRIDIAGQAEVDRDAVVVELGLRKAVGIRSCVGVAVPAVGGS